MALKGNQNALYEDVKLYFSDAKIRQEIREKAGYTSTTEKAHGQVEKREYYQTEEIKWLAQNKEWNGIKSIGMEEKTIRDEKGERKEYRYYISSLATGIKTFRRAVRVTGAWRVCTGIWT